MMKKITLLLSICWMLVQVALAQERLISGTVTDAAGKAVAGATVTNTTTKKSTSTTSTGSFTIPASTKDILVFSFLGMETQTVSLGAQANLNISLKGNLNDLDEIVVVAYGSQTKKSLVGSVASLDAKTLEKQQLTSVTTALQGTVAGVSVVTAGGQPGSNPTIRIRGISSINANAGPLYVVDGVPFNGNLNTISADQIESMNVLKDASSTALYGSRGANGVVLITTKSGAYGGKTQVSASAIHGLSTPAVNAFDVVGAADYMKYFWEAKRNTNQYVNGQTAAIAGQNAAASIIGDMGYNPFNVAQPIDANGNIVPGAQLLWDTNWEDELVVNTAQRDEYSVGVNGGGEKTKYFFSGNYLHQDGSIRNSDFKRLSTRLNIDSKVKKWLTLGLKSAISTTKSNNPTQSGSGFNSPIGWIYGIASVYPVYRRDVNGNVVLDGLGNPQYDYGNNGNVLNGARPLRPNYNAVGTLFDDINLDKSTEIMVNGYADVKFTDYLSFKTTVSYENFLGDSYSYSNPYGGTGLGTQGAIAEGRNVTTTLNTNNNLSFNKGFGNHKITANAIFESYQYKFDGLSANGTGFLPDVYVLNGATIPASVGGYINEDRLVSYLARAGYNYKNKYFIEGSFRRDGSTKFAQDQRWGNFFSIGGSWIISDEEFLANNKTLSLAKLRASYGQLGNNSGFGLFPYRQGYNTGYNEINNTGVILSGAVDPNLTWETTAITDIGLDFGLFKNRIEGTIGYFNKESIDLIYDKPLPSSTGNSSITTNIGSLRNYGIEFNLNGHIIQSKKVNLSAGFNITTVKNKITSLTQPSVIVGDKRYAVGKSIYDFYIEEWAGVDPADGYGMWYKDVLDANGNPTGERTTTKVFSEATRYDFSSALPKLQGGFNTDLQVGNFDFNMLFNFSFGGKIYDSTYAGLSAGYQAVGVPGGTFMSARWQKPGDVTDIPLLLNSTNNFTSRSTRFLFDNDYIRLKAITLGYAVPTKWVKQIDLSNVRVFLRGDNLLTWQSHKGIDPEQGLGGGTANRSLQLKTVSLGLNVNF